MLIEAGRLIDGISNTPRTAVGILVVEERIQAVGPLTQITAQAGDARVIDLSGLTVLVAVAGDPLADITELERVRFLMKGGTVYISQ